MAACRSETSPASGEGGLLSRTQLAARAGVTPLRVDELTNAGILRPGPTGQFVPGDVDRIRIIGAFSSAGVPLEALARAVRSGAVSFAYYDQLHPEVSQASAHTFGELKERLGERGALAGRLLTAFGPASPDDDAHLAADDEQMLLDAVDVVAAIGPAELGMRVARLLGEGARRTSEAALDVYGLAAIEVQQAASGLPGEEDLRTVPRAVVALGAARATARGVAP